jgi:peptidoglycan/xylan/chitin deacetylase (PgdA/CDA1 family)
MADPGSDPRPRRRARERGRAASHRARARGRPAALGFALIALGLLAVALLGGGGRSRAHARRSARAGEAGARQAGRLSRRSAVAAGGSRPGSAESPELRALIAQGRPIYCGARRGNEVALTFDDGPGPYTRLVIAKLRKHRIAATFFIVGRNIPLVPGATAQERALGAVGDHTFTHPLLTALAPAEAEREIARAQAALERSSGGPVFLFRPPYGGRDPRIDAIAQAHGLLEILWTVDSADSLRANYAGIERNVIGGLRPGAIILMHENHGQTVRALLTIFSALQRKHLRAVSVPQLLSDDPPSAAQLRAGGVGCGIGAGTLRTGA